VSKNKNKPAPQPAPAVIQNKSPEKAVNGFRIPYPALILILVVLVVYFPSFSLGFTELDDTIFINEFRGYNEDLHNLVVAFTRGLFDAAKDPYYRPLFSDAMILNYHMSGEEPAGYHMVNVLLHLGSVLLLYRLLPKLGITSLQSFLLALLFAVHPVLTQAVAWIPGRNDTMLAVFVLSFLLNAVSYATDGRARSLVLSGVFLLLAFFTKETAVFAAPAAFCLLVLYKGLLWNEPRLLRQYAVWAVCFVVWYAARSSATIESSGIGSSAALVDMVHRLPVIVQYTGKILFPFNQSVFPTQEDTVIYFGIAAIVFLAVVSVMNKGGAGYKPVAGAVVVFLLFLMPALLVPASLNAQTFEHRLYLPAIGILLLLPHTVLFRDKLGEKQLTIAAVAVCVLFAGLNMRHQRNFADPLTFWTQAVETSPNSAYANMMLAARLDKSEMKRSEELFRKAYRLNPKEKYLNFYMGELLQKKDSVLASEPYLLAEKKISDYVQCDFYLARVAMEKRDIPGAIAYLESYLKKDRFNPMAHNNLVLLYKDSQQMDKARAHVAEMKRMGMEVPASLLQQLGM